jgi:hypothetical protein
VNVYPHEKKFLTKHFLMPKTILFLVWIFILLLGFKSFANPTPKTSSHNSTTATSPSNPNTTPCTNGEENANCRRGLPQPLDNVFEYITDYPGPVLGIPDTTTDYPLTQTVWKILPFFQKNRIRVYAWFESGISFSSSKNSNAPMGFAFVPNFPELDQAVIRIAREVDTYQTDHTDWGFHFTNLYGIDYRFTTADGYFSSQLLKNNQLSGYDSVEVYGLIYFPHVAQGMVLQFGRFLSPPDIESSLSPDNFLFTHSIFFDFDAETLTGINAQIMLNPNLTLMAGIHAGDDIAPWTPASHFPSGLLLVRWVSSDNNDSLFGGITSINDGKFKGNHANQQQFNLTWSHRIGGNPGFINEMEWYYMYVFNGVKGGTCLFGPSYPYASSGGCGEPLPGLSSILGFTNDTEKKLSDNDFLSIRESWVNDVRGERSGFATPYWEFTIGITHHFNDLLEICPEMRYEFAVKPGVTPFDNGTRRSQTSFNLDLIQFF